MFHLLFAVVKLLPTQRVDEHRVLLQVLLQRVLVDEDVGVLIVDEDLLVLEIVECVVVDGVGVVERVRGVFSLMNKIMIILLFEN